jgi:photosystem II stability/assembly factor-like uncharacterized protein
VDRDDPAVIYAAVINDKEFGGIFVTRDAGDHWSQANAGLPVNDIFTLAQAQEGGLLAGTNHGVYFFDRKLARWQPMNLVLNPKTVAVVAKRKYSSKTRIRPEYIRSRLEGRVSQLSVTANRWFAASSAGLFTSLDQGHSWRGGSVAGLQNFVAVDALHDVVAAATPAAVLISSDSGTSWAAAALPPFVTRVFSIAITPDTLWITTRQGAFYTHDRGATWGHIIVGLPARNLISLRYDSAGQRLLGVATSGEIFATRDGHTWDRIADPGWAVRAISVAAGRLLGITAFSGIVAQPLASSHAMTPAGSE